MGASPSWKKYFTLKLQSKHIFTDKHKIIFGAGRDTIYF